AGAHERPGERRGAARGRGLPRGTRDRATPRHPLADARGGRLRTLLVGARQIVTCRGPARARRGRYMAQVEVLRDAAVLIDGGRIRTVGTYRELRDAPAGAAVEEVRGVLFPGFVDCHTHAVFGAPRLDDHQRRALGEDYKTIASLGGGILQSVRDVRARPEAELTDLTRSRVERLLAHGSTTIEAKSGYGLDPATELKQLRALATVAADARSALVPTFLGAHEVPPEFRDRRADYVRLLCDDLIPTVAQERLAVACDVFCEPGVFDVAETRAILTAARRHGLGLKLHADELEGSGGAELAVALGVSQLGLRHAEALLAVTVNAAAALGLAGDRGQIAPGLRADLVSCEVSDWREVAYWMGANLVTAVWTGGSACPLPTRSVSLGL